MPVINNWPTGATDSSGILLYNYIGVRATDLWMPTKEWGFGDGGAESIPTNDVLEVILEPTSVNNILRFEASSEITGFNEWHTRSSDRVALAE